MSIRTANSSWFSRKISQFDRWLQKDSKPRHGNIEITTFLSVSAVILTLSAFLYLGDYYNYFDINYFRVFSFEDGLSVLYEKGRLILLFPMILGFVAIALTILTIIRRKDIHKELKKNSTFLLAVVFTGSLTGMIFSFVGELPLQSSIWLGAFSALLLVTYFLFDVRTVYFYPLLFGFGLMLCAGPDVQKAIKEKVTYNLTMIDETLSNPIVQGKGTFWIGTTSKVIFFYNDSTSEVTEIPVDQVRKIDYVRPKAFEGT